MFLRKNKIARLAILQCVLYLTALTCLFSQSPKDFPAWNRLAQHSRADIGDAFDNHERLVVRLGSEDIPEIYAASVLNYLHKSGAKDLYPRFYLSSEDKQRALAIFDLWADISRLENRLDAALYIQEKNSVFYSRENGSLKIAELYFLLGRISDARGALGKHLRSPNAKNQYFRVLYLLASILVAEGNAEAARDLLMKQAFPAVEKSGEQPDPQESEADYLIVSVELLVQLLNRMEIPAGDFEDRLRKKQVMRDFLQDRGTGSGRTLAIPGPSLLNSGVLSAGESAWGTTEATSEASTESTTGGARKEQRAVPDNNQAEVRESNLVSPSPERLIQLGSFSNLENARRLVGKLSKSGHPAFIFDENGNHKILLDSSDSRYRGSPNEKNPARLLLVLKEGGLEGFLVEDPR